jgi:hypothetical protein
MAKRDSVKMKRKSGLLECVRWIESAKELPDAGVTVLMFIDGADEPVWLGYFEEESPSGNVWTYANGMPVLEAVTHWAEMLSGPVV